MNFNLEYYRNFFFAASYKSFTKAADHLGLTQPAVSLSVKKLETEFGCRLFTRNPQGLRLTKEGIILYDHVRNAFEELQSAENQVMKLAGYHAGELKIGATETSLRFFLIPELRNFQVLYPDISISISGTTTYDTSSKLKSGEIEAAFLISPLPPEFQFDLFPLRTIQDIPVAGPDYPIDHNHILSLEELASHPLISVTADNSIRSYYENWFLEHHTLFTPKYTVKSTGLILPLVRNNLGIGILPSDYAMQEIKEGTLHEVRIENLPSERILFLASNPELAESSIAGKFREFILDACPSRTL